jgi:hypothetical protein
MFVSATISTYADISEIDKPVDNGEVKTAVQQPTIAGMIRYRTDTKYNIDWKEAPFVETVAEPVFTSEESKRGYMIFRRAISDIVYPNTNPKPYERINSLSDFGCRGEFESITFTLYPKREMKNLKVRISDLKMENNLIPSAAISVRLQTYWKIPYPLYFLTKNFQWRRCPELLEDVTQHSSPAKECQRYLLTVHVPDKAKAGLYNGSVTVWDDGYEKAVKIPVSFRVMSFDLKKDPEKHFSACVTDDIYLYNENAKTAEQKKWNKWVLKASENNYRSMKEHGFDVPMQLFSINYNSRTDEVYIPNEEIMIETMQKAGFDFKNVPFVFTLGDVPIDSIIRKYTKNKRYKRTSHWDITEEMMPEEFVYKKITEIFKKFNDTWIKKGYPEFYLCPLDEMRPNSWKFGQKVFSAIKDSGMKTFITKDPGSSDARYYKDIVDAFCSQSFNPQYNEVVKNKNLSYWCYPNHNSNEIRIPTVMCNGGRMTYGFGLWKSGYKVIMPWAWSSWHENPEMLRKITQIIVRGEADSPVCNGRAGNVYDDDLNVVNTIYWECFREGYDDGRYIYTLQQAIVERENNKDKECRKLVNDGKEFLQNIWDTIKTEQKYKGPSSVSILPEEFDNLRWQMALLTEKLSRYKGQKGIVAPSVIVNANNKNQTESIFSREKKRGNLLIRDLGDEDFGLWKSNGYGVKISTVSDRFTSGKKCMKMDVIIDHRRDSAGSKNGQSLVGWAEVQASFKKDKLDITKYEFFKYNIMVDSDRDEVADDMTEVYWNFISAVKGNRVTSFNLGQVPQRTWIPVMIPIKKLIDNGKGIEPWKSVSELQFGTQESDYADGTKLTFYLDEISLISFKNPVINEIKTTSTIVIPANRVSYQISVLGTAFINKGEYRLETKLINSLGKVITSSSIELMDYNKSHSLNVRISEKDKYTLRVNIINNKTGKIVSTWSKIIPTVVNSIVQK